MTANSDMMRDSEREDLPELYRLLARLAMLLYAKTSAPKYLWMTIYYFVWWQTCSDADKKLYNNFFYKKDYKRLYNIF